MAASAAESPLQVDENRVEWLRLLAHPHRFQIVELLLRTGKPLRVTDIYQALNLDQAIASAHLINLRNRGVLDCKPVGTARLYWLSNPTVGTMIEVLRPLVVLSA